MNRLSKAYTFNAETGRLESSNAAVPPKVADYLDQLKERVPFLFGAKEPVRIDTRLPMGQTADTVNPFAKGPGWNLTKQGEIFKRDPARAKRLAAEAGVQLTGLGDP
jgi:hypothetical protein